MQGKMCGFHGHIYKGFTCGYKAALYVMDLLSTGFANEEQIICISENAACGVESIQAILECSVENSYGW